MFSKIITILLISFFFVAYSQQPQWRLAKGSEGIAIYDLDFYRPNPDTMYAKGSKWMMSTDKGETWTERYSWSAYGMLKVHPSNSKIIYENEQSSGTSSNDFYITHLDTGATKIFSGRGIPSFALAVDYKDKQTVYVGVADFLLKTKEGYPDKEVTPPGGRVLNIAIAPSNDSILVAVCEGDVYKSNDKGISWTSIRYGGVPLYPAIHPTNPEIIAVSYRSYGAEPRGIQLTTDGGMTWLPRYNGIDTTTPNNDTPFYVGRVMFNEQYPYEMYALVSGKGLFYSDDMGSNWISFNDGMPPKIGITSLVIDTINNRIYAGMYTLDSSVNGVYIYDFKSMSAKDDPLSIPKEFQLLQNYPNPFNPTTIITYILPARVFVLLTVYDILGRKITILIESVQNEGEHQVNFNASSLPSGVYLYRLQAGEHISVKKMIIQK